MSSWRRAVVGLIVVVLVTGATACDSSTDDSEGTTAPAGDGTEPAEAGAPAGGVSEAEGTVAEYLAASSPISVTEPLSQRPEEGVEVVFLQCGVPVCAQFGDAIEQAAADLGWSLQRIDAGLTPETIVDAYEQAVAAAPDAVLGAPAPRVAYEQQLAEFTAAGIPYVQIGEIEPVGDGITGASPSRGDFELEGRLMADWVVADTDGAANTALFVDSSFNVLNTAAEAFAAEYERLCEGCALAIEQVSANDTGTAIPGQVVAFLQANPDVNYVAFALGSLAIGVPAAISDAGLADRVKIVSRAGDQANFTNIVDGLVETATVGESSLEGGYRAVDTLARALLGDDTAASADVLGPHQILTADTITDPGVFYEGGDIQAHYRELWRVE